MNKRFLLPPVLIAAVSLSTPAGAALVAYEGFDYASGTQTALGGGTGWTGNWTSDGTTDSSLNIAGTGLSQGSLQTAGLSLSNTGAVTFRSLSASTAAEVASQSSANGDIWISFVAAQPSGSFGGIALWNIGAALADVNTNYSLILGRNSFDSGNWSWSDITSVGNGAGSGVAVATQVLYVMHLDYQATSTAVTLYLFTGANPTASSLSGAAYTSSIATVADSSGNRPVFDRLRVSGNVLNLDEIRIGTTSADVMPVAVPESSSYALAGAGALLLLARRRRRA